MVMHSNVTDRDALKRSVEALKRSYAGSDSDGGDSTGAADVGSFGSDVVQEELEALFAIYTEDIAAARNTVTVSLRAAMVCDVTRKPLPDLRAELHMMEHPRLVNKKVREFDCDVGDFVTVRRQVMVPDMKRDVRLARIRELRAEIARIEEYANTPLTLSFDVPEGYPHNLPRIRASCTHFRGAASGQVRTLLDALYSAATGFLGEMMIFQLVSAAQHFYMDFVNRLETLKNGSSLVSHTANMLDGCGFGDGSFGGGAGGVDGVGNGDIDIRNPTKYIGNITKLLETLPDGVKVTHIENVLRADLAQRFELYEQHLREKYAKKQRYLADKYTGRTAGFHGTTSDGVMFNIIANGLLVPGDNNSLGHRLDTGWYGKGIYLSPKASVSIGYAKQSMAKAKQHNQTGEIVACAVLPGRVYTAKEIECGRKLEPGYDSHVDDSGDEMVLFAEAAVLPCYVLHYTFVPAGEGGVLDYYGEIITTATKSDKAGRGKNGGKSKEEVARMTAHARKHLPFGYGPAGTHFKVLEVAPVSDDEEEFGSYQADRHSIVTDNRYQDCRW